MATSGMIDDRTEQLINRRLDGDLSEAESLELDKLLIRLPEARAMLEAYERADRLAAEALRAALADGAGWSQEAPYEMTQTDRFGDRRGFSLRGLPIAFGADTEAGTPRGLKPAALPGHGESAGRIGQFEEMRRDHWARWPGWAFWPRWARILAPAGVAAAVILAVLIGGVPSYWHRIAADPAGAPSRASPANADMLAGMLAAPPPAAVIEAPRREDEHVMRDVLGVFDEETQNIYLLEMDRSRTTVVPVATNY